jgi:TM2 domain-containing membrane protein YozV
MVTRVALCILTAFILLFFIWAIGRAVDYETQNHRSHMPSLQ